MEFLFTHTKHNKASNNQIHHNWSRRTWLGLSLFLLIFFLHINNTAFAALSHDQSLSWQTLNSEHFELHFHNGEQALALKSLNIAEQVFSKLQGTFDWVPEEKIEIILSDEFDTPNGFVIAPFLPSLRITLFPTTPDQVGDVDDWLTLLITHELTHALHIDKAQGKPLTLRKIFGRYPLSFPNILQPPWILEGLATYLETDEARNSGRGQDDIFKMMMRMEVKRGIKSYEEVNMPTSNWPAETTHYLYGVHFFQFLENQYSRASIKRFIAQYSDNLLPFALNKNSTLIFGKTMPELWSDFEKYLQDIYQPQLTDIAAEGIVDGQQITQSGYYKNYLQPLENGDLLYTQYDGTSRPSLQLKKADAEKAKVVVEIRNDARLDYHPEAGVIVSQIEIYRNVNYFYDLFKVDIDKNKIKRLTRGDRYRRATWSPNGKKIIALHNENNKHTLALLNADSKLVDLIWEGRDGEYIGMLDWSPDNENLVASVKRKNGNWNLETFSLQKRSWTPIITDAKNEVQPQYSPDGKRIIYSANYTGVYNIYEYDIETKKISRISNVEGGAFKPIFDNNDQIFYLGYTQNGYDIFKFENQNPIAQNIRTRQATAIKPLTFAPVTFNKTQYSAFSRLWPTWWTPTFTFNVDNNNSNLSQVGGYVTGSDALNIHSYDAAIAYDINVDAVSGEINYTYDRIFPLLQTHLSTINRDNKQQQIYHFELLAPLLQREKLWYLGVTARKENLNYKGIKPQASEEDYLLGIGSIYDTRKTNIVSNSPSNGRLITFTAESSELLGSDFNGKMYITKWQEYIALKPEQVLAFRFIAGIGTENPRSFQLGGYFPDGGYYRVDPFSTTPFRSTLYNQRRYALRGYAPSTASLSGRRMMMYNLEWRFPIKRFEKTASSLPIGIQQISGTVFTESGAAWEGKINSNYFHSSVGTEVKIHLNLFYLMPTILRAGYAYGMSKDGEQQFYLSVGSSY